MRSRQGIDTALMHSRLCNIYAHLATTCSLQNETCDSALTLLCHRADFLNCCFIAAAAADPGGHLRILFCAPHCGKRYKGA